MSHHFQNGYCWVSTPGGYVICYDRACYEYGQEEDNNTDDQTQLVIFQGDGRSHRPHNSSHRSGHRGSRKPGRRSPPPTDVRISNITGTVAISSTDPNHPNVIIYQSQQGGERGSEVGTAAYQAGNTIEQWVNNVNDASQGEGHYGGHPMIPYTVNTVSAKARSQSALWRHGHHGRSHGVKKSCRVGVEIDEQGPMYSAYTGDEIHPPPSTIISNADTHQPYPGSPSAGAGLPFISPFSGDLVYPPPSTIGSDDGGVPGAANADGATTGYAANTSVRRVHPQATRVHRR